MSKLPIVVYGDTILRTQALQVEQITDAIKYLATEMLETMHAINALGLAAPQIGKSLAMFTINGPSAYEDDEHDDEEDVARDEVYDDLVILNPVISNCSGSESMEEGCLSIPGIRLDITRPTELDLAYTNLQGERVSLHATGLLATVIQHENDHLNGVMIVDHIGPLRKQMIKKQLKKIESGVE